MNPLDFTTPVAAVVLMAGFVVAPLLVMRKAIIEGPDFPVHRTCTICGSTTCH